MPGIRADTWAAGAIAAAGSERCGSPRIDWLRLGRRCALGGMLVLAVVQIYLQASGKQYGIDFRGGTWSAGRALLSGRSPFPSADPTLLLRRPNGFVTPPLLALVGAPFSILPFGLAVVAFNLLCTAALVGALRLLGVRDRAFYVAYARFPFVSSLGLGQPDGLFALAAAVAWRYRDSPRGAAHRLPAVARGPGGHQSLPRPADLAAGAGAVAVSGGDAGDALASLADSGARMRDRPAHGSSRL